MRQSQPPSKCWEMVTKHCATSKPSWLARRFAEARMCAKETANSSAKSSFVNVMLIMFIRLAEQFCAGIHLAHRSARRNQIDHFVRQNKLSHIKRASQVGVVSKAALVRLARLLQIISPGIRMSVKR